MGWNDYFCKEKYSENVLLRIFFKFLFRSLENSREIPREGRLKVIVRLAQESFKPQKPIL